MPANDPATTFRIDNSLSIAFLVLMERLTPVERAVFLLCEVFDYEYREIAGILDLERSQLPADLAAGKAAHREGPPSF